MEIQLLRDICLCCQKMLKVFIEEKLKIDYLLLKPQSFGLISTTDTLLNETGYAIFKIYRMCDEMTTDNLCLLYRVSLYILPKLKIIGQPTIQDELTLRDFIDMQKI